MAWYNITNATGTSNLFKIATVANEVTFGWYGNFIVIGTFFITFFSLKEFPTKNAATAAFFMSTFVSLTLYVMNMVAPIIIWISMAGLALCAYWLMLEEQ